MAHVVRQRLPGDLREDPPTQAAIAAKAQVLSSEIAAMPALAAKASPACILMTTLADIAASVDAALATSPLEPVPPSFETTIQAIAAAFDRLQFDSTQSEPPRSIAPALLMLGLGRVSHLLEALSDLEPEGEIARFIAATSADREALLGLARRLAPTEWTKFDPAELERLRALDEILARTEASGCGVMFRRFGQGEEGERGFELLEVKGNHLRSFRALIASQGETGAIVSRFTPKSGDTNGPEEIEPIWRLNAMLTGRTGRALSLFMALFGRNWFLPSKPGKPTSEIQIREGPVFRQDRWHWVYGGKCHCQS